MSIDWQSDPELADLVRRARNGGAHRGGLRSRGGQA